MYNLVCSECGKSFMDKRRVKICRVCRGNKMRGENNPNYGKRWSKEQRERQSKTMKSIIDDNFKYLAGSANRGVKFSQERIEKMHGHRTKESYGAGKPKTEDHREKLAITSKERFTVDYKAKQRKVMEERGYWVPLNQKSDYQLYFKEADWIDQMFNLFESILLTEYGVFNAYNNTNGVVRDHKFSRSSGFMLKVFPEILRHPENCDIILHGENVRKHHNKNTKTDSLSLEELFDNIKNSSFEWKEQKLCLKLIKLYEQQHRWKRNGGGESVVDNI